MTLNETSPASAAPRASALNARPAAPLDRLAARPLTGRLTLAALALVIVVGAGFALRPITAEMPLLVSLSALHVGAVQAVTLGVYAALEPPFAICLAVVTAGLVWARLHSWRVGLWFGLSVAVAWLPVWIIKQLVHRERPDALLLAHPLTPTPHDLGYPSGHTAFVTVFAVVLATLLAGSRWRGLAVTLGALAVAMVALSVLLDGVHYPSDTLASMAWGLAVTPAVTVIVARVVNRGGALLRR
ncbi:phosphatase PAP2 family protein [Micrococcales bacterium 31B]|nr:phosphatase PAP2 family protein [Micrococcales bacterium 31B]